MIFLVHKDMNYLHFTRWNWKRPFSQRDFFHHHAVHVPFVIISCFLEKCISKGKILLMHFFLLIFYFCSIVTTCKSKKTKVTSYSLLMTAEIKKHLFFSFLMSHHFQALILSLLLLFSSLSYFLLSKATT